LVGVPSQEKPNRHHLLATMQADQPLGDNWLGYQQLQKSRHNHERFNDANANAHKFYTRADVYKSPDTAPEDDDNWAGDLRLEGHFEAFGREHRVLLGLEYSDRSNDLAFGYSYLGPGNIYTGEFQAENVIPGGAGNQPYDFDFSTDNKDNG